MTDQTMPGAAGPEAVEDNDDAVALAHTLFQAARDGNDALLGAYLEAGAPATMTNAAGDSLLMLAAYHGHAGTAGLLLQHGADANTANDRGQTPLAGAAFKGYPDVARVLLGAGADPDAGAPSARAAAQMFARAEILDLLG
jgi:ankyrin repeat protein